MKKKTYPFLTLLILIISFFFFYKRANRGYPKDVKIEEYSYKEIVNLNDLEINILDKRVENIGGNKYLAIDFSYKNKGEDINIVNSGQMFKFYQNFSSSIMQNIREIEKERKKFNPTYDIEDFVLRKGEEKKFTGFFLLEKKGVYKNVLLFAIDSYMEDYKEEYDKGRLFYKLINLGDVYD